jgi:hypothetical protein
MVIFGPRETRSRPIEGRLRLGMDGQAIWPFELPSPVQFDEAGWQAVRVWEHDDPEEAAGQVEKAIKDSGWVGQSGAAAGARKTPAGPTVGPRPT